MYSVVEVVSGNLNINHLRYLHILALGV
jgi:hypothetical protein